MTGQRGASGSRQIADRTWITEAMVRAPGPFVLRQGPLRSRCGAGVRSAMPIGSHILRNVRVLSSVALRTGRYHGRRWSAMPLPFDADHFDRLARIVRTDPRDICPPERRRTSSNASRRMPQASLGIANGHGGAVILAVANDSSVSPRIDLSRGDGRRKLSCVRGGPLLEQSPPCLSLRTAPRSGRRPISF